MTMIHALGILLMLMIFIYYFYLKAPSSNSSAPKKENSSLNSSKENSSLNSSIQQRFKYDVFLSFSGGDTRKNFVDHLYHALKDKGIYTYKDDEKIKKGGRISDELIKAIEDSKYYIIVFSKNYASSSWCLEELVKIMECHKMTEHNAYPVFYDVEPTEVRHQSGAVGEAFSRIKRKSQLRKWIEVLKKVFFKNREEEEWKGALKDAADLAGWELKNTVNGHEANFIKKIVHEISLQLRPINFGFDEKLVGMETRVEDVVSSLELGIDEVRMIGIKGMGGAGKTTTARAVFDHLSNAFEAKSFVENVREVSNASMFGLKKLQEQVLSNVINEHVTLDSVNDGKNMMNRRMCGKKVLLVLDDVDHIDQLEALARGPNLFKPGSRILITTRDEQVLVAHRVNLIRDIDLLSEKEAICLFSRYAFGRELPSQGYEELSEKVVSYASGLPLTIKVLGSFLCGKERVEWVDAIERLKNIPLRETLKQLELSYISLEDDYKEIFLDIACILKGKSKEDAITILESCGFHARNGLKVLEQRSLITISEDEEYLGMHDHIEEMGKNIVRRLHPDEPNKHSRLWINEETEDIFANDKGTEATRCLKLATSRMNSRIVMKGLVKMKKLRYLEVNFASYDVFLSFGGEDTDTNFVDHLYHALKDKGIDTYKDDWKIKKGKRVSDDIFKIIEASKFYIIVISKMYASSSSSLLDLVKIMECQKMAGHTAIPVFYDVDPTEVRRQRGAVGKSFALYEKEEVARKLCEALTEAANLSGWEVKNAFDGDEAELIRTIVEEISHKLRFVNSGVDGKFNGMETRIRDEPNKFVGLDMKYSRMAQLGEVGEEKVLKKLKFLSFSHSNMPTFDFGMTPNLETLFLKYSNNLVELCMPVTCQKLKHLDISDSKLRTFDFGLTPNIETLSLRDSHNIEELCMPVSCQKLKHLEITDSKLRTFDLGLTPNLEQLVLSHCADFVELHVSVACPNLKFLELRKLRLRSLDLELIPNLENLDLAGCDKLVEINAPIGCLKKVVRLNLWGCLRFTTFQIYGRSKQNVSRSLASLYLVGESLDLCPLHPNSNLLKLQFSCSLYECLPSDGNIEKLISFGLCACTDFKKFSDMICSLQSLRTLNLKCDIPEFPKDLGKLECLEELCLSSTKIKHLPDSICMLKCLKSLEVKNSDLLEKLPENLGRLVCLETLDVTSKKIEFLPGSFCLLKHLKCLILVPFDILEKLPEDLGRLECLERLHMRSKKIEYLPDSICKLKHLKWLDVAYCSCLGKLPEDIGQLQSLDRLDLSATKIKYLPDSICMLKHLNSLDLDYCALFEKLPEDLGLLACLKRLIIDGTSISHLPQSIFGLKGLFISASSELLQKYENHFSTMIKTTSCWRVNVGTKTENQDQAEVI